MCLVDELAGEEDVGFTYIVFLGEAEELSDLGGALGTETLWVHNIGDTWELGITLLYNGESENGQVHSDDASTDGFTLTLTGSARTVARVTVREQETDTVWVQDTLLHWETLLVVASGDLEYVALELIANGISWDFSTHSITSIRILSSKSVFCL